MKQLAKFIFIFGSLSFVSSLFASKARMESLGQGTESIYLEDTRSIFINPSKLNVVKNYVITEWGTANNTGIDSLDAPTAEGGFFKESGVFIYGLYLGSDFDSQNALRIGGTGYAGSSIRFGENKFLVHDNGIDFFFAGDMGTKWGARFHFAEGNGEVDDGAGIKRKQSTYGLGMGIVSGRIELSGNAILKDESEGADSGKDLWAAETSYHGAAVYHLGQYRLLASYRYEGASYTNWTFSPNKTERRVYRAGFSKLKKINAKDLFIFELTYNITAAEDVDGANPSNNYEKTIKSLPLVLAFETRATRWLILRGSVKQSIFVNEAEIETAGSKAVKTIEDTTDVSAGASLVFGKLFLDGMIGTTGMDRNGTNSSKRGVLSTDNLMTRVSARYNF